MTHELKTIQPFYDAVVSGDKTFEIRKFDRDYKVGDFLELKEWVMNGHYFSGDFVLKQITYILSDAKKYGLTDGYCILGIK